MSFPLNQKPCEAPFSIAYDNPILTIENGIQGTTEVVKSTILMTAGRNDDIICDNNQMNRTIPDLVHLYGDNIDCSLEKEHIVLDPVNFGYATGQELIDAINAL